MKKIIFFLIFLFWERSANAIIIDVTSYHAVGDGITMNTINLQKAIDDCSASGGGEVYFPAGKFVTGGLYLRSNVTIRLSKNAVILGSTNREIDYGNNPDERALFYASKIENIAIVGEGEINGRGEAFRLGDNAGGRPLIIKVRDCKKIRVEGIHAKNSAFWTMGFFQCENIMIDRVNIYSHANHNNDGIDIVDSRNVTISNCIIDTDDDNICFKSENAEYVVENVSVTNCVLASSSNFIKCGTAGVGGFRNISISNIVMHGVADDDTRFWHTKPVKVRQNGVLVSFDAGITKPNTGVSGIALEVVDGGFMEQISITNIVMQDIQTPLFIRRGDRTKNKEGKPGHLRDVIISQIVATSQSRISSSITGVPGMRVENVIIKDIIFNLKGGGRVADAETVVYEAIKDYPECRMFGAILPSYGFFIRHANNITFDNIQLRSHTDSEERYAIVADDVNLLRIMNSVIEPPKSKLAVFKFNASSRVMLLNNTIKNPCSSFVVLGSMKKEDIKMSGNTFELRK